MKVGRTVSQFWRRVSVVLMGTAAAQAIPIATLPFLTRMLPSDVLGKYFVWLGVATVASVVATLRLDIAIFSAKSQEEVGLLLYTAIASAIAFTGLLLISLFFLHHFLPGWVQLHGMTTGSVEAACMAALLAISQTALAVYVYSARFARQALARMIIAGSTAICQLIAVAAGFGIRGMILGQVCAMSIAVAWLLFDVRRTLSIKIGDGSLPQYLATIKENWRFPVFSMPADFISSFSAQLPIIMIGARFGGADAGQYALTNRTLAAPVGLLAGSVLSVFKEEASRQYRETGQCYQAYIKTLRTLALLGIPPFVCIFLASQQLFAFVFGEDWGEAGRLAAALAPMFYLKFLASPLSYTMYLANRQLHDLYWQIILLTMTFCVFKYSDHMWHAVTAYSLGYSVMYIFYLQMSYRASRGQNQ